MAWCLRSGYKVAPQPPTHLATVSRKWNMREGVSTTQTKYPWRRSRSQLSDVLVQEQLGNIRFWQVGNVRCHEKRTVRCRNGWRWTGKMQGIWKRCGRWRRGSSADGAARHRNGALANRSSAGFCLGYVHATGILVRPWQWRACAEKGSDCGRDALRLADRRRALARGQGASATSVPGPAGPSGQGLAAV